jgi:hypothetical protein
MFLFLILFNFNCQEKVNDMYKLVWTDFKTSKSEGVQTRYLTDQRAVKVLQKHFDLNPTNKFLFQWTENLAKKDASQVFQNFFKEKVGLAPSIGDWRIILNTHVNNFHF